MLTSAVSQKYIVYMFSLFFSNTLDYKRTDECALESLFV